MKILVAAARLSLRICLIDDCFQRITPADDSPTNTERTNAAPPENRPPVPLMFEVMCRPGFKPLICFVF